MNDTSEPRDHEFQINSIHLNKVFSNVIKNSAALFLSTNRLSLEPINIGHVENLLPILNDEQIYEYLPQNPPTREKLLKQYEMWEARRSPDRTQLWLNWAVKTTREQYIGYFQVGWDEKNGFYVAYVIGPKFQKQGFAFEGLSAVISFLRVHLEAKQIRAWIDTRNVASIQLIKKLGFVQIDFIKNADEFKGSKSDEYIFLLETKSLESSNFDLQCDDGENLKANPRNSLDVAMYADLLYQKALQSENHTKEDLIQSVRSLGLAGHYYKILGRFAEAHRVTSFSLESARQSHLPDIVILQQEIRYFDVLRFQQKWEDSEKGLKQCLHRCLTDQALSYYTDTAYQHLGKLMYDQNRFEEAHQYFNLALQLRFQKGNSELTQSSHFALSWTSQKLSEGK